MPETAGRIESLFAAAVALPPAERGAYLERECSGDPTLRDQGLALLGAHDRADHVIDRPVNADPDQTAGYAPTSEPPGTVIAGRYKLLEEIGQGGMGTVWAAEQTVPVRRKVALKLIKAGMDSRAVLARFEAERQALALMDHPNIAKTLDGGLTDSGRPYFVMEYVKGVPITEYCDATRLSVEERLNLFIQVCSALQHAHQKGIIHRDLKPSNILVAPYDDKPVPKVIDFGLAKAMHQSLTEKTLYTAHEMVLGTPLYMSPEQAQINNLDVDTRADIYSLGVLLYELLTGTTPLERKRFKEAAWDEVRRMIREEEPPRPSMRLSSTDTLPSLATFRHTEPAKLMKLVRGELDWIVMKALEKDRTRRYETASGFARDIQRYLDDEVVEARPPSTGYRIGKFVRRHKAQVIAAGLVMSALLAGIAGTTWGLFREARAKTRLAESLVREKNANDDLLVANDKVKKRYELAVEAVKTFHTGVSEDFLLKEDSFKDLRNRLLSSASEFYGKLSVLLGKETDSASRRALAQSNFELAELTSRVGREKDALAAHRAVLAMREELAAADTDPGVTVDVARSLTQIAGLLEATRHLDDALAACRQSELRLAKMTNPDRAARLELATCRSRMGSILYNRAEYDEALSTYRMARSDLAALATAPNASNDSIRSLGSTIIRLGLVQLTKGRVSEAEAEYRDAVAIFEMRADKDPAVTEFHVRLAASLHYLGFLLRSTGRLSEAESVYRKSQVIYQKLADDAPAVSQFRSGLASSHWCLGVLQHEMGKPSEAEAELLSGLALHQKLADDQPAAVNAQTGLGYGHKALADLLSDRGKPTEALQSYRRALAIFQRIADENPTAPFHHNALAATHQNLGLLLSRTGETQTAEAEYREARAIYEKLAKEDVKNPFDFEGIASCDNNLSDLLRQLGRQSEARLGYEQAIAIGEGLVKDNPMTLKHRSQLASSYRGRGLVRSNLADPAGAAADTRRALALLEGLPSRTGGEWFETACAHAALVGLAGNVVSGVPAIEGKKEAEIAIEHLKNAIDMGYCNPGSFRNETALDPLRDRADFKKLMAEMVAELEKNAPAQPEKKRRQERPGDSRSGAESLQATFSKLS